MKLIDPSSLLVSTIISIISPSFNFPIGPPANASGPICPKQAPVETPEKRASVIKETCLPKVVFSKQKLIGMFPPFLFPLGLHPLQSLCHQL